jgi:hypothetical protein
MNSLSLKILSIATAIILTSCKPLTVIHVVNHWPYCGGKLPNPEEESGKFEGFSNHAFQVTEGGKKKIMYTDEFGYWKGRMDVSQEFTLIDIDKTCSLEELKAQYPLPSTTGENQKQLYEYLTPEEWLRRCSLDYVSLGALSSKENIAKNGPIDTLSISIERTCFTGINPIIKYIGPKPR